MKLRNILIRTVLALAVLAGVLGTGSAMAESGCHRNPPPPPTA